MIVVVAKWTVQSELLASTLRLLTELQKASRLEPDNLVYEFYQDPHLPENILIYEEYKNAEAIEAHRMTKHFQDIVVKQIVPHLTERSVKVLNSLAP